MKEMYPNMRKGMIFLGMHYLKMIKTCETCGEKKQHKNSLCQAINQDG